MSTKHLSGRIPWQQDQPAMDRLGRTFRGRSRGKGTRRHGGLEGMGGESTRPSSSPWAGPWGKPRRSLRGGRGDEQSHGRLYGRACGVARGRRQALRESSALRYFPRRRHRDHAGAAHTRALTQLRRRPAQARCRRSRAAGVFSEPRTEICGELLMPNTVRLHRVLARKTREGLSRVHRAGRDGQVAAAKWLHLHRASHGPESRWIVPDVVSQFHYRPEPFIRRPLCRARYPTSACATRTSSRTRTCLVRFK